MLPWGLLAMSCTPEIPPSVYVNRPWEVFEHLGTSPALIG